MTYEDDIRCLSGAALTFDSIRRISCSRCQYASSEYDQALYDSIERGQAILETEEQVDKYMQAFGKKHYLKFVTLFDSIPRQVFGGAFDLVDWGCGQGVGVIALCDFIRKLPDRNIESKLRQITLIEPSEAALKRAIINTRSCFPESTVVPVHKTFEQLAESDFNGVATLPRIHLFSNVLDMNVFCDTKYLLRFADKVKKSAFGRNEFLICVSPTHNRVNRTIDQFIDHIADPSHFQVCPILAPVEKVFTKEADGVAVKMTARVDQIQNIRVLELMASIKNKPLLDELNLRRDSTSGQRSLVELVAKQCDDKDHVVLFRPNLMGDAPDMLILKPRHKVLLIKVCESPDNVQNAADYIESIKSNFYDLHSKGLIAAKLQNKNAYGAVRTVLYFPWLKCHELNNIEEQLATIHKSKYRHITYWCPQTRISFLPSNFMDDTAYVELTNLLRPLASKAKLCPIELDRNQRILAVSECACRKKISGVVGSGKTTVLVARAISALKRTHKQVLVLTYNITLRNYIEHMIVNQFGYFTRNQFYVVNFHEFLLAEIMFSIATHGLDASFKRMSFDDDKIPSEFKRNRDKFRKYDCVFIDEVQDYKHVWLDIIYDTFVADDGEYVLVGDEKQNIYRRDLDQKRIKTNVPGPFAKLKSSHRANEDILRCVASYQKMILSGKYDIDDDIADPEFLLTSRNGIVKYGNIGKPNVDKVVDLLIKRIHEYHKIPYSEITVVGCSVQFLQACEKEYRKQTMLQTEPMFEVDEEVKLIEESSEASELDLESLRRSKKLHFNGFADVLKFSTIDSYKGWEADTIVELVEPSSDNTAKERFNELIYTGFTRAKRNLFVINCGNAAYEKELRDVFANCSTATN